MYHASVALSQHVSDTPQSVVVLQSRKLSPTPRPPCGHWPAATQDEPLMAVAQQTLAPVVQSSGPSQVNGTEYAPHAPAQATLPKVTQQVGADRFAKLHVVAGPQRTPPTDGVPS